MRIIAKVLALIFIVQFSVTGQPKLVIFKEVAEQVGLKFQHYNGMTGKFYLPEITGSGGALFDFDNDGDLDVYLVQGNTLEPNTQPGATLFPWRGIESPRGRLFRNDLKLGKLTFTDVTQQSGIVATGYGMGVAAGDINNDGLPDLYLTNLGSNQMYLNKGGGKFTDVTKESGTDDSRWSTSASFFDYDRDGWLDLMVVNYADFSVANSPNCYAATTAKDYCTPRVFRAPGNRLFHNKGNGVFEDVTVAAGVSKDFGHGLGIVTADFNNDSWIDIYVANDGDQNQLWTNQKNGAFVNDALLAGAAVNRNGQTEAGMGVDVGDFDGNGTDDIFVTHLMDETNTLFVNSGQALFEDRTREAGLGMPGRRFTGFGTFFFDYDNDGWLDLFVANGAVQLLPELVRQKNPFPLGQSNQLFRNNGKGSFVEIMDQADLQPLEVSRGAALGDVDNDGDTDVLVTNNNGPARLLSNQVGNENHWLGLRLIGKSGRDMLGAQVEIVVNEKNILRRRVRTDGSYLTANDPRVLVGLGASTSVKTVRVRWPDATVEEWKDLSIDQYTTLKQGTKISPATAQRRNHSQSSAQILPPPRKDLVALRFPDLSNLEESVSNQMIGLQNMLVAAAKSPATPETVLSETYGKLGQIYHAYSLISPAHDCYLNASLLAPKDFRWTYLVAKLDHQEGRFEVAIRRYRIARTLRSDYVAVPVNLGNIFLELNRLDEARASFNEALAIDKNNPAAHYGLGQIALSSRNYSEAIQHFDQTLERVPSANRVHYSLAMAYRGLGDVEKVKAHLALQGSVGVRVSDPLVDGLQDLIEGERVHLARGKLAFEARRYAEAAEEFRKAVTASPNSVTARINLGATLSQLGDQTGAIDQFEAALSIEPGKVNAHYNLAILLAGLNSHEKAIAHLQSALKIDPNDSSVRYMLGRELTKVGRPNEALAEFSRVVQADPNNEDALLEEVKLLHQKGEFKQALDTLEKNHARYPQKGRTVIMLACILATSPALELRNGTRALELAQRVYDGTAAPHHGALVALALAELGRCSEARDWHQRMLVVAEQQHFEALAVKLRARLKFFEQSQSCRPPADASLNDQ